MASKVIREVLRVVDRSVDEARLPSAKERRTEKVDAGRIDDATTGRAGIPSPIQSTSPRRGSGRAVASRGIYITDSQSAFDMPTTPRRPLPCRSAGLRWACGSACGCSCSLPPFQGPSSSNTGWTADGEGVGRLIGALRGSHFLARPQRLRSLTWLRRRRRDQTSGQVRVSAARRVH